MRRVEAIGCAGAWRTPDCGVAGGPYTHTHVALTACAARSGLGAGLRSIRAPPSADGSGGCRPDEVKQAFERYGEVRDVYMPKDFYTGCVSSPSERTDDWACVVGGRASWPTGNGLTRRLLHAELHAMGGPLGVPPYGRGKSMPG
jgi:hypothetical protein